MFIPKYFFEKFIALLEAQHALGQRQTEDGLQRVLAAKDAEVRAVVAAKDEQISFLTAALVDARQQIGHERQRAEAAVDILLTKNGEAGPIRNADLIREVVEREAAAGERPAGVPRPESRQAALNKVFAQVAAAMDVGDGDIDPALDGPLTSVPTVGGVDLPLPS